MNELLIAVVASGASFCGSYAALKVHVHYIRRDVDHIAKRLDDLAKELKLNAF